MKKIASVSTKPMWTELERGHLRAIRRALTHLRRLDKNCAKWPILLIEIGLSDPADALTLSDLGSNCDIPQPSMTRLIRALEIGDDKVGPKGGLRLVQTAPHPTNHKALTAYLTTAGVIVLRDLTRTLEG